MYRGAGVQAGVDVVSAGRQFAERQLAVVVLVDNIDSEPTAEHVHYSAAGGERFGRQAARADQIDIQLQKRQSALGVQ